MTRVGNGSMIWGPSIEHVLAFSGHGDNDTAKEHVETKQSLRSQSVPIKSAGAAGLVDTRTLAEHARITLSRIDQVQVVHTIKGEGHSRHVVEVYLRSPHTWSLDDLAQVDDDALRALLTAEREPDYEIAHRFHDYVELRNNLQAISKASCCGCITCMTLKQSLLPGGHASPSAWSLGGLTEATRREALTAFLQTVLCACFSGQGRGAKDYDVRIHALIWLAAFLHRRHSATCGVV